MAHIKSISFASVSRDDGCTCDRCGQWIKNVWTVEYSEGESIHYGIDCWEKVYKGGKLNKFGEKLMREAMKSIASTQQYYDLWKNLTEEEAEERGMLEELKPDSYCNKYTKSYWCGKTFDEYKAWMLDVWFPARFEEHQKKVDRFAKINFDK